LLQVANCDNRRVCLALRALLDAGASPARLQRDLERAIAVGVRLHYTQQEKDIAKTILLIGGPKLLHAMQSALQLPSVASARVYSRHDGSFRLTGHPATLQADVTYNLQLGAFTTVAGVPLQIVNVAIDESVLREALRYDRGNNEIVGLCSEHVGGLGSEAVLLFTDAAAARTVVSAVHAGDVHLATYMSLVVAQQIAGTAPPVAAALMPSCRQTSADVEISNLSAVVAGTRAGLGGEQWVVVSTDGDSNRRAASRQLQRAGGPVGGATWRGEAVTLTAADLPTASHGVNAVYVDEHHVAKRERSTLLRPDGMCVNGFNIGKPQLTQLLIDRGVPESRVDALLNPLDAMNVPSAITLLQHVVDAGLEYRKSTAPDLLSQSQVAVALLSVVLQPVLAVLLPSNGGAYDPIVTPGEPVLHRHVRIFAAAACMTAVLYHQSGTQDAFMPHVLVHDTLNNCFSVLALALAVGNSIFAAGEAGDCAISVAIALLGSNICEDLFSVIRGAMYDPNCDAYQAACRLHGAGTIAALMAKYPEWQRRHRRALDASADGITLARLRDVYGSSLQVTTAAVFSGAFNPVAAYEAGLRDTSVLLGHFRRHIRNPETVWEAGSATLRVLTSTFPSLMRRTNNTIIGAGGDAVVAAASHAASESAADTPAPADDVAAAAAAPPATGEEECDTVVFDALQSAHSTHSATVDVNGCPVHKQALLNAELGGRRHKLSNDRCARFRQRAASKAAPGAGCDLLDADAGEAVLCVEAEPLVAVAVRSGNTARAAVCRVARMQVAAANGPGTAATEVLSLPQRHLTDARVTLTLEVLQHAGSAQETGAASAPAGDVTIAVRSRLVGASQFTVPGALVRFPEYQLATSDLEGHARTVARFDALQLVACVDGTHLDDRGVLRDLQRVAGCSEFPLLATATEAIDASERSPCGYTGCRETRKPATLQCHVAHVHALPAWFAAVDSTVAAASAAASAATAATATATTGAAALLNPAAVSAMHGLATMCGYCGGSIEVCLLQLSADSTHAQSDCARARKPSKNKHGELKAVQCMNHPVVCTDCCPPAGVFHYGLAAHRFLVHRGMFPAVQPPSALGVTEAEIARVKELAGRHERAARGDGGTLAVHRNAGVKRKLPVAADASVGPPAAKRGRSAGGGKLTGGRALAGRKRARSADAADDSQLAAAPANAAAPPAPVAAPAPHPAAPPPAAAPREERVVEWAVYLGTEAFQRDIENLRRTVQEGRSGHFTTARATVVAELQATAARLSDELRRLDADLARNPPDELSVDAGLRPGPDARSELAILIAAHQSQAETLAARSLSAWAEIMTGQEGRSSRARKPPVL
jgi:hypothetical protein